MHDKAQQHNHVALRISKLYLTVNERQVMDINCTQRFQYVLNTKASDNSLQKNPPLQLKFPH